MVWAGLVVTVGKGVNVGRGVKTQNMEVAVGRGVSVAGGGCVGVGGGEVFVAVDGRGAG